MDNGDKIREVFLFPVDAKKMLQGEKDKAIKIFLNQLDLKIKDEQTRKELRQIFLDCINSFARFSKGLLKNYSENADVFQRLVNAVEQDKLRSNTD